jgi:hypothetical protein
VPGSLVSDQRLLREAPVVLTLLADFTAAGEQSGSAFDRLRMFTSRAGRVTR